MRVLINSHKSPEVFAKLFAQFYREYSRFEYVVEMYKQEWPAQSRLYRGREIILLDDYLREKGYRAKVVIRSAVFINSSTGWAYPYVIAVFDMFDLMRLLAL